MVEVDARLRLGAVALDAKGDFHEIARLAEVFLHDLHVTGALLLVHLRSEAAGEFQNPMARPTFILARFATFLVRNLTVAVFDFPRESGRLRGIRERLIADRPNLLPPRRTRPMVWS